MAHIKFKDFPQEIKDLWRRRVTDETFYGKPDEFIENRRSSGFTWVNSPEGGPFWAHIMKDSDFRPYYERYGFAVGEAVCLSDVGKAEYINSTSNPHDEIGHVESIGPEPTFVVWAYTGKRNAYFCEHLVRPSAKYELKQANNINKKDDKIISRITPTITSGQTPRGTIICSPRSKIALGC